LQHAQLGDLRRRALHPGGVGRDAGRVGAGVAAGFDGVECTGLNHNTCPLTDAQRS
ncbi:MAG: hypothetical protein HND51_15560, partial [Chloroflexi bacterium]|nr:hypothetical protein [Chloroflexota bacterium]